MSALSTQPPTKPEMAPYVTPMTRITNVAANPIPIEIWPPSAVRVKRSRPKPSVPNGCSMLGGRYVSAKFASFGSMSKIVVQIPGIFQKPGIRRQ